MVNIMTSSLKIPVFEPRFLVERWVSPLGQNADEFDEFKGEERSEYEQIEDERYGGTESKIKLMNEYVLTPFGILPLMPYNNPAKAFKWYIIHVNFKLTRRMLKSIDKLLGVEILGAFSNYRFRVAIGKAFDDEEIITSIKACLIQILLKTPEVGV